MGMRACCRSEMPRTGGLQTRMGLQSLRWIAPSAVLALMPKCPLCVASYYTLLTGLGMSLAAAVVVRNLLIVVCIGMLTLAALGALRKLMGAIWLGRLCATGFARASTIEEQEPPPAG
jgi:hypothetical protein